MRPGDEMSSAEEMDEQVAGHAAAVGFPLAPLEKVFGIERNFRGSAQKARPVTGFG